MNSKELTVDAELEKLRYDHSTTLYMRRIQPTVW